MLELQVGAYPHSKKRRGAGEKGAALVYVLGLLLVTGILVSITWRLVRQNEGLAVREMQLSQARLLSHSGVDHALFKINESIGKSDFNYSVSDLNFRIDGDRLGFLLDVIPLGLFLQAYAQGKVKYGTETSALIAKQSVRIEQLLDLGDFPAVGLLNREGNLVLAGTSEIHGSVMLWRGEVRKATSEKIRWQNGVGHIGPVWDSTSVIWDNMEADFTRVHSWMEVQDALIQDDILVSERKGLPFWRAPHGTELTDTLLENHTIVGSGLLLIGSGARLLNCTILAKEVEIKGNAQIENGLVYSSRNMRIREEASLKGQFLARDSLVLDLGVPQNGYPVFYVHGRPSVGEETDSIYIGELYARNYQGEGIFMHASWEIPDYNSDVRIRVDSAVFLHGLIFTPGFVQLEGSVEGSVICQNFRFQHSGTIWFGHLKNVKIKSSLSSIPVPVVFPGLKAEAGIRKWN